MQMQCRHKRQRGEESRRVRECVRKRLRRRPWTANGKGREEVKEKEREKSKKAANKEVPFIMVAIIPDQSAHPSIQINHTALQQSP